jgi:SpoVK/Ycf46/Vps4 family AAA+-type ATPase
MKTDVFKSSFLEKLNSRNNYNLFGYDIHEDLHWGKLFLHMFGEYYSRYRLRLSLNNEAFIKCMVERYSLETGQILRIDRTSTEDHHKIDYQSSEVLLIIKEGLFIGILSYQLDIIYSSTITEAERKEIIELAEKFKVTETEIKKFHMVQFSNGNFELADFNVKPYNIDVETHYNENFQVIHKHIFDSLKTKNKNGLVLLHGKYGTGKTYYLRHLISNIDRKFIYFPLNMISSINSPEFLPFITEHQKSVLILEDCESLLLHRENGLTNSSVLSNLLNIGDGLLADALSINVICTFNAGIKKIDDAILRKGRLIARYEFKELELCKAQTLAHKLGKDAAISRAMTVSDIYNLEDMNFENTPLNSVGFKVA